MGHSGDRAGLGDRQWTGLCPSSMSRPKPSSSSRLQAPDFNPQLLTNAAYVSDASFVKQKPPGMSACVGSESSMDMDQSAAWIIGV